MFGSKASSDEKKIVPWTSDSVHGKVSSFVLAISFNNELFGVW